MTLPVAYRPAVTAPLVGWAVELDGWGAGGFGTPTLDANSTEWWVTKVEGWRDRPPMRVSSTARQADHGSFDAPSYLDSRIITIEGVAICTSEVNAYLSADIMASVCSDFTGLYPLVVTEPGRPDRRAYVRINDATKVSEPYGASSVAFDWSLQLRAPDPRRYADAETDITLTLPTGAGTGLIPPLTPPLTLPSGVATNVATAVNAGTIATRPVVTFVGPVTNPAIANITQGRTLSFLLDIAAGDSLTVDFDQKSVLLNGEVSRAWAIEPGSAWFDLGPGNNDIQYQADAGTGQATIVYSSAWI